VGDKEDLPSSAYLLYNFVKSNFSTIVSIITAGCLALKKPSLFTVIKKHLELGYWTASIIP